MYTMQVERSLRDQRIRTKLVLQLSRWHPRTIDGPTSSITNSGVDNDSSGDGDGGGSDESLAGIAPPSSGLPLAMRICLTAAAVLMTLCWWDHARHTHTDGKLAQLTLSTHTTRACQNTYTRLRLSDSNGYVCLHVLCSQLCGDHP